MFFLPTFMIISCIYYGDWYTSSTIIISILFKYIYVNELFSCKVGLFSLCEPGTVGIVFLLSEYIQFA